MFKNSKGNAFPRLCSLSKGMLQGVYLVDRVPPLDTVSFPGDIAAFLKTEKFLGPKLRCTRRIRCRKTLKVFPRFTKACSIFLAFKRSFLPFFRRKLTFLEGSRQDKMQKCTETWIIGSLVYFSHGKTYTLLQRKIEAQLQV